MFTLPIALILIVISSFWLGTVYQSCRMENILDEAIEARKSALKDRKYVLTIGLEGLKVLKAEISELQLADQSDPYVMGRITTCNKLIKAFNDETR